MRGVSGTFIIIRYFRLAASLFYKCLHWKYLYFTSQAVHSWQFVKVPLTLHFLEECHITKSEAWKSEQRIYSIFVQNCLLLSMCRGVLICDQRHQLTKSKTQRLYELTSLPLFTLLKQENKTQSTCCMWRRPRTHKQMCNGDSEDIKPMVFGWFCQ